MMIQNPYTNWKEELFNPLENKTYTKYGGKVVLLLSCKFMCVWTIKEEDNVF